MLRETRPEKAWKSVVEGELGREKRKGMDRSTCANKRTEEVTIGGGESIEGRGRGDRKTQTMVQESCLARGGETPKSQGVAGTTFLPTCKKEGGTRAAQVWRKTRILRGGGRVSHFRLKVSYWDNNGGAAY